MTYEIYRYIFIGGAVLSGIMLLVSILVFFLLRIPTVIGYLTGTNARKGIENIRSNNEKTGNKSYKTGQINKDRGSLTGKISHSGRVSEKKSHDFHGMAGTEKITSQSFDYQNSNNETTVLPYADFAAGVYDGGISSNETTVLDAGVSDNMFTVEYEITYIHTDEVIS